ncbi:MAG: sigma-70 family RNA polymerase sigma factor [Cyanobacteriota bacterium]
MVLEISLTKQQYSELDLKDLILRCQNSDMMALEELVKRNQKIVFSTIYHLLSDKSEVSDLAQEVLFRMCRSIKSLRNPSTFKWWLNQIVTNLVYDQLRRKKRKLNTISMDTPVTQEVEQISATRDISDSSQQPDENILNTELDVKIRQAINNLPEQFRTVIVFRELQGLSYDEIAKLTGTSLGTVKSRIARARSRLQEELKPYINVGSNNER